MDERRQFPEKDYSVIILYFITCLVYYIIYQIFKNTYDLLKQTEAAQPLALLISAQKTQIELLEENSRQSCLYLFRSF